MADGIEVMYKKAKQDNDKIKKERDELRKQRDNYIKNIREMESKVEEQKVEQERKQKEIENAKVKLRTIEKDKNELLSTLTIKETDHKSEIASLLNNQTQSEIE